jgi:hypothetical protein
MQVEALDIQTSGRFTPVIVKQILSPIACRLRTGVPAATVDRLFDSRHIEDLRLISAIAFIAVRWVLILGLPLAIESAVMSLWSTFNDHASIWFWLRFIFQGTGNFLSFFGPVLAIFGAVLAWIYQVGSARLGVVDLFACEISTLCRVASVVETARRYVDNFDRGPPPQVVRSSRPPIPVNQFTSQESYFPVFENNTRDLQTLEARVVVNITAFYTYMKAVRDSLRALTEITPQAAESQPASNESTIGGRWHDAMLNVIFTLYLGLESARLAVDDLVEYEPEKAERTVVILLSELETYGLLARKYPDKGDAHHERLMLREPIYRNLVPALIRSVEAGRSAVKMCEAETDAEVALRVSLWEPAGRLLLELQRRYDAVARLIHAQQPA